MDDDDLLPKVEFKPHFKCIAGVIDGLAFLGPTVYSEL